MLLHKSVLTLVGCLCRSWDFMNLLHYIDSNCICVMCDDTLRLRAVQTLISSTEYVDRMKNFERRTFEFNVVCFHI